MFISEDRVQETTTSTGTGAFTPGGAWAGYRTFDSVMGASDRCFYSIDNALGAWEVGVGTWDDTAKTMARTPLRSSNSDALVDFAAGTKNIFMVYRGLQPVQAESATIATTGNTDKYFIAPVTGYLVRALFSSLAALATSDTNYITFTITNLGQAGAGTTLMLGTDNTKVTGGTAILANTKRTLVLSSTLADTLVTAGDRLLCRAAATGTLANTVTLPVYQLSFAGLI